MQKEITFNKTKIAMKFIPAIKNMWRGFMGKKEEVIYAPYGDEDQFPQNLISLSEESGTLAMCISTYARFIEGDGFTDINLSQKVVNSDGETMDNILKKTAVELSQFGGFAWLVTYNALGKKASLRIMPFEKVRKIIGDDGEVRKYAVIKAYDNPNLKATQSDVAKEYYPFDDRPEVIQEQFIECEGYKNHKGQIFYYYEEKPGARVYPKPLYFSVLEDVITEAQVKRSKKRDVLNGFSPSIIITEYTSDDISNEDILADQRYYQNFIGGDGAKVMIQYANSPESKVDVQTVTVPNLDRAYQYAEESTAQNIMKAFRLPQILYGIPMAGKLGASQEMKDAAQYAQKMVVRSDQNAISEAFRVMFDNFYFSGMELNTFTDYTIKDLTLYAEEEIKDDSNAINNPV